MGTRLKKAATIYQMWRRKVSRSKSFTKKTKVHVFRVMVMSVLLYGAGSYQAGTQKIACLPDEMLTGYYWCDFVGPVLKRSKIGNNFTPLQVES